MAPCLVVRRSLSINDWFSKKALPEDAMLPSGGGGLWTRVSSESRSVSG